MEAIAMATGHALGIKAPPSPTRPRAPPPGRPNPNTFTPPLALTLDFGGVRNIHRHGRPCSLALRPSRTARICPGASSTSTTSTVTTGLAWGAATPPPARCSSPPPMQVLAINLHHRRISVDSAVNLLQLRLPQASLEPSKCIYRLIAPRPLPIHL
ncbi:hypothetical protein ACQJBY_058854 [Aegilops geniculata]